MLPWKRSATSDARLDERILTVLHKVRCVRRSTFCKAWTRACKIARNAASHMEIFEPFLGSFQSHGSAYMLIVTPEDLS